VRFEILRTPTRRSRFDSGLCPGTEEHWQLVRTFPQARIAFTPQFPFGAVRLELLRP
jgi:hypothetical protein